MALPTSPIPEGSATSTYLGVVGSVVGNLVVVAAYIHTLPSPRVHTPGVGNLAILSIKSREVLGCK